MNTAVEWKNLSEVCSDAFTCEVLFPLMSFLYSGELDHFGGQRSPVSATSVVSLA